MSENRKRPGASISLRVSLTDLVTPAGRGKRLDATFSDPMGERKRRIEVLTKARKGPKSGQKRP